MGPIELSELQVKIEELTMSYDTNIFFQKVPELAKMMIKEDDVFFFQNIFDYVPQSVLSNALELRTWIPIL